MPSLSGASVALSVKLPSAPVRACPSCVGAPAPAAHKVTIELLIGCLPPRTCPLRSAANAGAEDRVPARAIARQVEKARMTYLIGWAPKLRQRAINGYANTAKPRADVWALHYCS